MPNHCQNRLTVTGPSVDLHRFKAQADEGRRHDGKPVVFAIENFVPVPPEGDPRRDGPANLCQGGWDWYTWRIENWATKWDVYDVSLREDDAGRLVYGFSSAWTPPTEAVRRIATGYSSLTVHLAYLEDGAQFYGQVSWHDEELLVNEEVHYDDAVHYDDINDQVTIDDPLLDVHVHEFEL